MTYFSQTYNYNDFRKRGLTKIDVNLFSQILDFSDFRAAVEAEHHRILLS